MDLFENTTNVFRKEKKLTEEWMPEEMPEREEELKKIANSFSSIVRHVRDGDEMTETENCLVYGKTGQGKTVGARSVLENLEQLPEKYDSDKTVSTFEVSLKDISTSYQAVGAILAQIDPDIDSPPEGYSLKSLNQKMFSQFDEIGGHIVLFLDEIDNLGSDDDLLYQIPRARSQGKLEDAYVSIIGVSNDLQFQASMSAKTRDSMVVSEVNFEPYDANQLRSILDSRVEGAFKDGAVQEAAIAKTAALAARDTGSARQALRLIRKSGDIACNKGDKTVTDDHVEDALDELETINVTNSLTSLTTNDQAVLLALGILEKRGETPARTKTVYSEYKRICSVCDMDTLSLRSIRDKIPNLGTYNLALVHKTAGGSRGGKRYKTELAVSFDALMEGFEQTTMFDAVIEDIDLFAEQSTLSQ